MGGGGRRGEEGGRRGEEGGGGGRRGEEGRKNFQPLGPYPYIQV